VPANARDQHRAIVDMDALLAAQRRAFNAGPPSYETRLDALQRLARVLSARAADLVAAVSADLGGGAG
jgi:acyl-CoA reductase-like NAD-dependent aldehyde dehydrogenase